jgi:hypothetical protein
MLYVVLRKAFSIHLGHDEPAVIGRNCYAVGKPQAISHDACLAIRQHQDDAAYSAPVGRRG